MKTNRQGTCAGLAPLHVKVGTPGGTEPVAHALASVLAEQPETVVISAAVDMANAFNMIYRAAMLQQGSSLRRLCSRW